MSKRKFIPIVGVLFVFGALLCGLLALYSSTRAANRVEKLTPIPATILEDSEPGREVLVEGRISDRNPVISHSFVAYIREEREIETDDEGTPEPGSWYETSRITPPLLLELSDGPVQIENSNYDLRNGRTVEEKSSGRYSHTRYKGIESGGQIIAVGVVVEGAEYPQINAEFVAPGTRESYVSGQRIGGIIFCLFSVVVAAVGGILILWDQVIGLLPRRIIR
jgi:hypothetical protein